MSRKYASMQEELAARKAAGEYGDLSKFEERFFRNEPEWVKKSREDAARSKRISEKASRASWYERPSGQNDAGRGKWSLHDDAGSWTEAPSHTPGKDSGRQHKKTAAPAAPKAKGRKPGTSGKMKPLGCFLSALILFAMLPILAGVTSVFDDLLQEYGTDDGYTYEYDEELWDEAETWLDETSSFSDADAFVQEVTDPGTDDGSLLIWAQEEAPSLLPENAECVLADGRIIIHMTCSETDDPDEVTSVCLDSSDSLYVSLDEAGYDDVPVAVVLRDADADELRLVIVDNMFYYASGEYLDVFEDVVYED